MEKAARVKEWNGRFGRYTLILDGNEAGVLYYEKPHYYFRIYINGGSKEVYLLTSSLVAAQEQAERWLAQVFEEQVAMYERGVKVLTRKLSLLSK